LEEIALVDCLKRKEPNCLSLLYDNYGGALYGTVLAIVKSERMAEEVLQDAFMKIWDNINSYDPQKGKLFTWMRRITHNLSLDKLRSREYRKSLKTESSNHFVYIENDDLIVEQFHDHLGLDKILNLLNTEQSQILELAYFKGFTMKEIGEELDMPVGSVKTKMRQTFKVLREQIGLENE